MFNSQIFNYLYNNLKIINFFFKEIYGAAESILQENL